MCPDSAWVVEGLLRKASCKLSPKEEWEAAEGAWGSIQKEGYTVGLEGGLCVMEARGWPAGLGMWQWRLVFGKSFQRQCRDRPEKERGRKEQCGSKSWIQGRVSLWHRGTREASWRRRQSGKADD
jgi:hypothetical protein